MSLTEETATDSINEESIFETEDEFDKSIASMDFEISSSDVVPNDSNDIPSEIIE